MNLTTETIKQLIKEELSKLLREDEETDITDVEEELANKLIETRKEEVIDLVLDIYSRDLNNIYKRASQMAIDKREPSGLEDHSVTGNASSLMSDPKWDNSRVDHEDLAKGVIEHFKDEAGDLGDLIKKYAEIADKMYDEEPGDTLREQLIEGIPELKEELKMIFKFEFLFTGSLSNPGATNTLDPRIMDTASSDFMQGYEIWRGTTSEGLSRTN